MAIDNHFRMSKKVQISSPPSKKFIHNVYNSI
jgi:hypothetical protein